MSNLFDAIFLEVLFARFCGTFGRAIYNGMHADRAFRADFVKRTRRIVKGA
jgi:hypothetical protein